METPSKTPTTTEERVPTEIQVNRLIAYLVSDPEAMKELGQHIEPKGFPDLQRYAMEVLHQFHKEFGRGPDRTQFLLRIAAYLKTLRVHEPTQDIYMKEIEKMLAEGQEQDASFTRAWALKVIQRQRTFGTLNEMVRKADAEKDTPVSVDLEGLNRLWEENYHTTSALAATQDSRELDDECAADLEEEDTEWVWMNTFPKAGLSVLAGMQGTGKSWFTTMMAAKVTTGRSFPTFPQFPAEKGHVLILQVEDRWKGTLKKRLRWEGADQSLVRFVYGTKDKNGKTYPTDLSTDTERLRRRIRELGDVKLVIVDPLSIYVGVSTRMNPNQDREVRLALAPLIKLAEEEKVAIVGIMHMNKNQMADILNRVAGAGAWTQVPRAAWCITRKKDRPDVLSFYPMKVTELPMDEYQSASFCFRLIKEEDPGRPGWKGHLEADFTEMPGDPREDLGPTVPEDAKDRRGKLKDAVEFLENLKAGYGELQDGIPMKELQEALPDISLMTWSRARKQVGFTTKQRADGWYLILGAEAG